MKTLKRISIALAALAIAGATQAQQYPEKPVTVVVPFTPGGSSDITARTVAAKLQESLGQSFIIDNKPGANGGQKNPDRVSFASSGTGSSDHLTAALFWQKTGTTGIHVPYKGGSAAHLDLIAGNADASFQNLGSITQHVKAGKMKILAVTSSTRDPAVPTVPTLTEAGVPGIEVYSWQAFVAPKGLPQSVKARLQPALQAAIKHPDVVKRVTALGFEVVGNSPAEFDRFLTEELARWKQVVESGGIKQSD